MIKITYSVKHEIEVEEDNYPNDSSTGTLDMKDILEIEKQNAAESLLYALQDGRVNIDVSVEKV